MDLTTALNELAQLVRMTDSFAGLSADKLAKLYEAAHDIMRVSAEYLVRATIAEEQVKALIAAICGDDGETQDKVGTQRAVIDALIAVQAWRTERTQGKTASNSLTPHPTDSP